MNLEKFKYVQDIFTIVIVFLLISPAATLCPPGWQNNGTNNCYFFTSNGKNWQSAETDCQQRGSHLASIHSEAENNLLSSFSAGKIWIGLNDLTQEGSFRWTDGSSLDFSNWGQGQPDFRGIEQCTGLNYLSFGVWNNFICMDHYAYICMKEGLAWKGQKIHFMCLFNGKAAGLVDVSQSFGLTELSFQLDF